MIQAVHRQGSEGMLLKHPEEIRRQIQKDEPPVVSYQEHLSGVVTSYVCSLSVYLKESNTMTACKIPTEKLIQLGFKYNVIPHTEALVVALLYMKRLVTRLIAVSHENQARQLLTRLSAYQIFALCLLMSLKMLEDNPFNNESFARLSGIQLSLLNKTELAFLSIFDYSLHIPTEAFEELQAAI